MNTEHLDKLKSRGYWRVIIRPVTFDRSKVGNILDLQRILESCAVRLRGWDFPHVDARIEPTVGTDWISQDIDWEGYVEYWQFFQSGQFLHLDGFKEDWVDERRMLAGGKLWPAGERLAVVGTVFRFAEIFEFAVRLSLSAAGDNAMHVTASLHGLKNRQLWIEEGKRAGFHHPHRADVADYTAVEGEYSRGELAENPRKLAIRPAIELFRRFGWDASIDVIKGMQDELRR